MKHAIARLTRDLETLATNERIARGEGRDGEADDIAAEASDVRSALDVLTCVHPDNGITPYTQLVDVLNIGRDTPFDTVVMSAALAIHDSKSVAPENTVAADAPPKSPRPFSAESFSAAGSVGGVEWEVSGRITATSDASDVHDYDAASDRLHCELRLLADRFEPEKETPSLYEQVKESLDPADSKVGFDELAHRDAGDGYLTFEQFVQHGIDQGVPLTRGMPWSFTFGGFPVTHERDDMYLVTDRNGVHEFKQGQHIRAGGDSITIKNP